MRKSEKSPSRFSNSNYNPDEPDGMFGMKLDDQALFDACQNANLLENLQLNSKRIKKSRILSGVVKT